MTDNNLNIDATPADKITKDDSMAKVNEKEKQNNAVSQHLKEEVSKRAGYDGPVRDGKAVSADIQQQKNLQQNNLPDGKRQKDTQQTLKKNVLTQSETR